MSFIEITADTPIGKGTFVKQKNLDYIFCIDALLESGYILKPQSETSFEMDGFGRFVLENALIENFLIEEVSSVNA